MNLRISNDGIIGIQMTWLGFRAQADATELMVDPRGKDRYWVMVVGERVK